MKNWFTLTFLFLSIFTLSGQSFSKKELKYKPVNLEEAVQQLFKIIPDTTQQKVLSMTENEFITSSHFGLGMYIRNNWIYWGNRKLSKHFRSIGIFQADDMSGIILICYYRQLHDQEWKLEEQIKFYQLYWELTKEHFQKVENDTRYEREVKISQDSLKKK